jgi:hypothetical protein
VENILLNGQKKIRFLVLTRIFYNHLGSNSYVKKITYPNISTDAQIVSWPTFFCPECLPTAGRSGSANAKPYTDYSLSQNADSPKSAYRYPSPGQHPKNSFPGIS